MFIIEDDIIYLTRGDHAEIYVDILNEANEAYIVRPGDCLTLTVREEPDLNSPVLYEVKGESGSPCVVIPTGATSEMIVGEYSADIQIETADGRVFTVWPSLDGKNRTRVRNFKNFNIMPEVTMA